MDSHQNGHPDNKATSSATAGCVLITGASRGIGQHLAAGFAAAGWSVHGTATSPAGAKQINADGHTGWCMDVRDYQSVLDLVEHIESRHEAINCLVNNAGVIETSDVPIWEVDPADVDQVVRVNVLGAFHMIRAVVPHMVQRGRGRVISLNSGAGVRSSATYPAYHASKSALFRLGGAVHEAGFDRGIRAFELAPGVVDTAMTRSMPVWNGKTDWIAPDKVVDLAVALAGGGLDVWSGRMIRAGADTVESLREAAGALTDSARTLGLATYGSGDPLRK